MYICLLRIMTLSDDILYYYYCMLLMLVNHYFINLLLHLVIFTAFLKYDRSTLLFENLKIVVQQHRSRLDMLCKEIQER